MKALRTNNLTKHFGGVHAVDNLSIGFDEGKITGLIGPNGSGKSTLMNLLSGVMAFDEGVIVVDSSGDLKKIKPHEVADYGITRTFQEVRLFEQMSVLDNILVVVTKRNVFSSLFEKHKKFHLDKAEQVLKKVGLWEKRDEMAKNLSYGQRKLLEISRVLAMLSGAGEEGEIFLFDEPFAGLFQEMRKIVSGILMELKNKGKTVILIEHNMEIIRELCDYIFVLDSGKLLAEGTAENVLSRKDVIEAYLGE
jgi:ABC-type branched-subunit amino acid transport system ATPase component